MSKVKKIYNRRAVLWECPDCLADNLHPTDAESFVCISCGVVLVVVDGPKSANYYNQDGTGGRKP